ncbi:MAG TPA: fused MFS/spermidine synthase [Kineosporiaceae bacterium]|nr:fused MFS/spermidine synthase [Kineosporiaceae bacterium]
MGRRQQTEPVAGLRQVETGTVALVPDNDGRRGWTMLVNGVPSSHVDLDDPLRLDFEYVRWIADVLDLVDPPGGPLRVAHLGGAGCSLPRYVAATRPQSRQIVFEIDPGVIDAAREAFGLRSGKQLRLRVADGRQGLTELPEDSLDTVIRDAFSGALVPRHLTTRQFLAEVARVLAPGGIYLANLADAPPLAKARDEAATLLAAFRHVVLIAEPAQFSGRRFGNVVVAASQERLPVEGLVRRLASAPVRARMLTTNEVRAFAAGRRPLDDEPAGLPR